MSRRILIEPVTRVEGHAKITIDLDEHGEVREARFHVLELRGFEAFCVGRPVWEMPSLTARICGICPVSHLMASSKAGDAILAVQIPPAAEKLRRLMNLAQIVQSHALSFFHMSAPDFFLGMESPPAQRNLVGLAAMDREFARGGIRLRQFGQNIIEALGGKKVQPAWAVPGGVRAGISESGREEALARLPESMTVALEALTRFRAIFPEVPQYGDFPGLFMGLVGSNDEWEHYDGKLRIMESPDKVTDLDPSRYDQWLGEAVEPWTYLKFPYYRPLGYPQGCYRVGPLARLNLCETMGTPRADQLLGEFRKRAGRVATSSFYYHEARLIEIVAALEKIELLLRDPELNSGLLRARASINRTFGIGCSEAPRGTLFHHYEVDGNGLLTRVNLLIATGQNNQAMNRTITEIARHFIHADNISEGVLNRIEAGIRAFDPCLSCSTHATGQMPMVLEIRDSEGRLLNSLSR